MLLWKKKGIAQLEPLLLPTTPVLIQVLLCGSQFEINCIYNKFETVT